MAALDFYFDYRSPYAYLAQTQVRKLGVEIAWRPFEILQLMDQVGNVPTSITCKPKGKYLGVDLIRWVGMYEVPFQRHPQSGSIDARRLLRATLAGGADRRTPRSGRSSARTGELARRSRQLPRSSRS